MPISSKLNNEQFIYSQCMRGDFEYSPDNIVIIDPKSMRFVYANQAAIRSLGYTKEELLSKTAQDIDVAFDNKTLKTAFESIVNSKDQRATFPSVHRRKDGSTFDVEVYLRCLTENENIYILVSATDTSVLKKAQEQLQFHATLFNNIPDAVIATDNHFCITSYNQYAQEIFGWNTDEAIGKPTHCLMNVEYLNPRYTREEVRAILFSKGSFKGEIIAHRKSGITFSATMSIGIVKDENGEITGTVGVIRDITEIKELETRLKDLNGLLEQRVVQKTEELTNVFDRISDGFTAFDINWNYTYLNKSAAAMFNREARDLIGKNVWEEFPETVGAPVYRKYLQAMQDQKVMRTEEYLEIFDKWFEGVLYPSPQGLSVYIRDITEKKKAEQELLASQANYRLLFEENPVPLWMSDSTTYRIVNVNTAATKLYGYSKEEMISLNSSDLKVPEEYYQLQELAEKGDDLKAFEQVVRHKRKNGELIYVRITANLIAYNGKQVWLAAGRDITQELLYEQNLKQSQQRLSLIFNTTENAMWLMSVEDNGQYRMLVVNDATARIFNMRPEDIANRTFEELFDMTKYRHYIERYEICVKSGEVQRSNSIRIIDGEERIFDSTLIPIKENGKVVQLLGINADITEQKRTERLIIESEEKYKALFERSPLPNWIYDSETLQFLDVNLAALKQYGYSKEEFLSMTVYDIKPEESLGDLISIKAKGFPESVNLDTAHRKKNGEVIKVNITSNALHYENRPARMAIIMDRTEQEKAKDELIATTRQLRELASHLQAIREEERTYIAREIHDGLGQQLTALKMDISWLNKKWNAGAETISNKLKGALELVDATINEVRKMASRLHPSILDDLGLAEAIAWQTREFSSRTGIIVNCSIDVSDENFSNAVSVAVFRICQEALTNIARHADATIVTGWLRRKNNTLYFNIIDNGKGFDLNEQSKKRTLGLLSMKERAFMLNGKYSIKSKPGEGTEIAVEIPLEG